MAFSPAFSCYQSPSAFNIVVVSDESTGNDAAIVARRVYVQNYIGAFLVNTGITTDYTPWALSDSVINLDILSQSTAATVTVDWIDSGGNVLYTDTETFCFDYYAQGFGYYLSQMITNTPNITNDANWMGNYATFWALIKGAENAITFANDVADSQNQLNIAINMELNQSDFF